MKVVSIFGTRPEAIKMAPVIKQLESVAGIESQVWVTGQHRQMLDQMLQFFEITPDVDLDIMQPNQTLEALTATVLQKVTPLLEQEKPDMVLVQGDTTSAMASALAAFYQKIAVGHVEAGLRTENIYSPFPEEVNRRLISPLAALNFAPTLVSAEKLARENIDPNKIFVTGNTVIDALFLVLEKIKQDKTLQQKLEKQFAFLDKNKKLILVTGHRRENLKSGLRNMCGALLNIAKEFSDVEILYPVHLNPKVQIQVKTVLAEQENIHLCEPVDYVPFVYLMSKAYIIVTDSGGIQEEAPSLGIPVLVTRDTTERPEGISAGVCKLVGTNEEDIYTNIKTLFTDHCLYEAMAKAKNPYGSGDAAKKIIQIIGTNIC